MAFRLASHLTRTCAKTCTRAELGLRSYHASLPNLARNAKPTLTKSEKRAERKAFEDESDTQFDMNDVRWAEQELESDYLDDDTVSAGHIMLSEHRQTLHYLRLIEHEMPKLVLYRKPFKPLKSDCLIVRSVSYGGEEHPVTAKRVVTVAVDDLPLKNAAAVHKFKLLAGPRWTIRPPTDGGVSGIAEWGNGFVKISCEDFANPEQNLKWISDRLDIMIKEANTLDETFKDVPLDIRHMYSKARKAKKGEHLRGRLFNRPTIRDFPQEWLPASS
ncbi:mitochondrial ribosomal small subunit component [Moniliophthora roreri MCA 2997]|uniref:Mitochondrial ribosomal small subunit component n=1 Tax=Moniliophthora roreri (strain MCA 2997) TaxID=1381753 RepID=V2Z1Z7_MONRO|nr:mitochondrial ribosomal small subunit component [Moniliophthora roreri MCA 2997]